MPSPRAGSAGGRRAAVSRSRAGRGEDADRDRRAAHRVDHSRPRRPTASHVAAHGLLDRPVATRGCDAHHGQGAEPSVAGSGRALPRPRSGRALRRAASGSGLGSRELAGLGAGSNAAGRAGPGTKSGRARSPRLERQPRAALAATACSAATARQRGPRHPAKRMAREPRAIAGRTTRNAYSPRGPPCGCDQGVLAAGVHRAQPRSAARGRRGRAHREPVARVPR